MGIGSFIGGVGGFLGSRQEAGGYKQARKDMEQLRGEAMPAAQMVDPFMQYRSTYAQQLNEILQGKRDFKEDPGYQWTYDEAMRSVDAKAVSTGYGNSGNRLRGRMETASGLASQQYSSIIDRLMNLSGAGSQNAAQAGSLYGDIQSTALVGRAEGAIGRGAAQGRGISALFSGASSFFPEK